MNIVKIAFLIGVLGVIGGCSYRNLEAPGSIPVGYYNAYYNSNAAILYKRPSSKFGCWSAPSGWDCIRR